MAHSVRQKRFLSCVCVHCNYDNPLSLKSSPDAALHFPPLPITQLRAGAPYDNHPHQPVSKVTPINTYNHPPTLYTI